MAFQQHPNGLSAHSRNQFAFDHLFGQQPHRPTRPPFRRRRADHGDNLLALALVQGRSFARTCGVEQRSLQPFLFIPLTDLPDGFGRKTKIAAHHRRGLSPIHLTQGQSAQYRAHRLQAAAQKLVQPPAIPRRKLDLKPHASAHDSAILPELARDKYQHWLPIYAVVVLVLLCYKCWTPQNGHRQSWSSRERARRMRKVAMECGLCRSGRMRTSGLEVGPELGD